MVLRGYFVRMTSPVSDTSCIMTTAVPFLLLRSIMSGVCCETSSGRGCLSQTSRCQLPGTSLTLAPPSPHENHIIQSPRQAKRRPPWRHAFPSLRAREEPPGNTTSRKRQENNEATDTSPSHLGAQGQDLVIKRQWYFKVV